MAEAVEYTCTLEAFRDLIIGMNNGATYRSYTFREASPDCGRAKYFEQMTQSITRRSLDVRRDDNNVRVHIS